MGLPRLVSSSCLSLHIPGSAPRPGPWTLDTGHWTLDTGHWTLDTGHWTLDTPPPPQDLDPWRLPVPAPRVQTAAYRETNITGEYLGLQIRLVLSYFYFSKNGPKNI